MIQRYKPVCLVLAALLLSLVGCKSTTLSTTWKDPNANTLTFKKVVVVVLNSSPAERRAQEEALANQIKRANAVASYTLIPDDQLKNIPKAKETIIAQGFDGAVILRLVDARQETTYVPPTDSWENGWTYTSYHSSPGYVITDTIVRAEVSLYTVPDGKLLWAGASETLNPTDSRAFAIEVAQAAAAELQKQGLLQK